MKTGLILLAGLLAYSTATTLGPVKDRSDVMPPLKKSNVHPCELPIADGLCKKRIKSWAFDSHTGKCVPFVFKGCQGNPNRFFTEDDCVRKCFKMRRTRPIS